MKKFIKIGAVLSSLAIAFSAAVSGIGASAYDSQIIEVNKPIDADDSTTEIPSNTNGMIDVSNLTSFKAGGRLRILYTCTVQTSMALALRNDEWKEWTQFGGETADKNGTVTEDGTEYRYAEYTYEAIMSNWTSDKGTLKYIDVTTWGKNEDGKNVSYEAAIKSVEWYIGEKINRDEKSDAADLGLGDGTLADNDIVEAKYYDTDSGEGKQRTTVSFYVGDVWTSIDKSSKNTTGEITTVRVTGADIKAAMEKDGKTLSQVKKLGLANYGTWDGTEGGIDKAVYVIEPPHIVKDEADYTMEVTNFTSTDSSASCSVAVTAGEKEISKIKLKAAGTTIMEYPSSGTIRPGSTARFGIAVESKITKEDITVDVTYAE